MIIPGRRICVFPSLFLTYHISIIRGTGLKNACKSTSFSAIRFVPRNSFTVRPVDCLLSDKVYHERENSKPDPVYSKQTFENACACDAKRDTVGSDFQFHRRRFIVVFCGKPGSRTVACAFISVSHSGCGVYRDRRCFDSSARNACGSPYGVDRRVR